jgi:transposase
MPAPVPLPIRQALGKRHQKGASTRELAEAFGLAPRTVRGLLQRARQRGPEGLAPTRPGPAANPQPGHPAWAPALLLRQEHPTWGAGLIRVLLPRQGIEARPHVRTLQRWFAQAGLGPAPPGCRPQAVSRRRATRPHETWQVDAAEEIPLADGTRVSWLRMVDEFSGAVLKTVIFPPQAVERGAGLGDPEAPAGGVWPLGNAGADPRR